jgi:hypothetical protein
VEALILHYVGRRPKRPAPTELGGGNDWATMRYS